MADDFYSIGDLVWAKMKGFTPWPAKVVEPKESKKRPNMKKPFHYVLFFGTNNYGWIPAEAMKPYGPFKEQMIRLNKTSTFLDSVNAIEAYIRHQNEGSVKSSDLPSIGEEIATIFSNGSNREAPHKDYSRQPFQKKAKGKPTSPTPESQEFSDDVQDLGLSIMNEPARKYTKPKKTNAASRLVKRLSSDDSNDTSASSTKRAKISKKNNQKNNQQAKKKAVVAPSASPSVITLSPPGGTSPSSSTALTPNHYSSPRKSAEALLMRSSFVTRPITPPLDVEGVSETLQKKNIKPSCLNFGFLGLGIIGKGIVKNLLNSGHQVTVWNRTPSKCRDFVKVGAFKGQTPADVIAGCDITFSCVSDPQAAKDMVFGNCGVLHEMKSGKGYIEMTSVDAETSQDIAEAIMSRGGRYLEAQVQGSKSESEEGTLIILAAGDKTLFDDGKTCFEAMGKSSFYLGEVGNACKMNLVVNLMMGATLAGLAESMALAERAGLQQKDVLEVLDLSSMASHLIIEKGKAIIEGAYSTSFPLQHMQKDLRLALELGDQLEQPLPLTATTNEMYKHAKRLGYGEHDVSAVYIRSRY